MNDSHTPRTTKTNLAIDIHNKTNHSKEGLDTSTDSKTPKNIKHIKRPITPIL